MWINLRDHRIFINVIVGDMVSDWLKMQDDVMIETGEPTWTTLVEALEKIEQKDVATSIKKIKGNSVGIRLC